jgi:hypothetical protein
MLRDNANGFVHRPPLNTTKDVSKSQAIPRQDTTQPRGQPTTTHGLTFMPQQFMRAPQRTHDTAPKPAPETAITGTNKN